MTTRDSNVASFDGGLIQRQANETLNDFSCEHIHSALLEHGVLLFRGFNCSLDEFGKLAEKHSSQMIIDPTRETYHQQVQYVPAGTTAIDLHSEHSNSPFAPDYLWFYCANSATDQGQTTYANGQFIWNSLNASTRQFFTNQKVCYTRIFPDFIWKIFVASFIDEPIAATDITREHLQELFSGHKEATIKFLPEDAIQLTYATLAYNKFDDDIFFVNSLIGPYPGQTICTEDGTALPAAITDDVEQCYSLHTKGIPWQNGDIALIDNHRLMHGRQESDDLDRQLFSTLSNR